MRTVFLAAVIALLVCVIDAKSRKSGDDGAEASVSAGDQAELETERRRNPCYRKKCQRGEVCVLDEHRKSKCVCSPDCGVREVRQERLLVCSNKNMTYLSECHLDQDHCLCRTNDRKCTSPGSTKILLEYYGACKELTACTENEMKQFPYRMRQWLFIIMEEMARRAAIGEYQDLLKAAAKDETRAYAVIWKFCDLDTDPQDRQVSRRELLYTIRALKAMEHCLVPFLDKCDANSDREITLLEWGKCLELEDGKITDKCHAIKKHRKTD
ncbi:unnamed protein product [Lymnaea stagnalis]|uniref:SPARC/Testican calcium-binding domain-containing protein n=1 Tax=Lymnaea stagnalis TaxID=6523 RepID=A0AAV2H8P5_LYMST